MKESLVFTSTWMRCRSKAAVSNFSIAGAADTPGSRTSENSPSSICLGALPAEQGMGPPPDGRSLHLRGTLRSWSARRRVEKDEGILGFHLDLDEVPVESCGIQLQHCRGRGYPRVQNIGELAVVHLFGGSPR